jgi:hypothetical protein
MKTSYQIHTIRDREAGVTLPAPFTAKALFLAIMLLFAAGLQVTAKNQSVIKFNLKYGFIKGGEANMIITDTIFQGKKAIHYYVEGRTTGVTDKIFKVHDIYESIVDAKTHLPLLAIRNIKERNYLYYNEIYFFQNNDSIYSQRTGGIKVPTKLNDLISVFFYFVNQNYLANIEQGKLVVLPVINGHDLGEIKIKHTGAQTVDTYLGKFDCHKITPEMEKGKVLKRSDGLSIYFSKKDKIPVLIDIDLRVGTLRAVLDSYKINGKEITGL